MPSFTRLQLEEWLKRISVKADNVLDVGGAQLPIKSRLMSFEATNYRILDLQSPHEKSAEPDIIADIEKKAGDEICSARGKYSNFFDVAFCIEVSEYWIDPLSALENIACLLKRNGLLYISFHFIYPHHNPIGEDCLRYTRWGCQKLLKRAGFEILEIAPRVQKLEVDYNQSPPQPLQDDIKGWYGGQKMRPARSDIDHNEIGYMIKARKI